MSRVKFLFLILVIFILLPLLYLTFGENRKVGSMTWGVSFSPRYAESLALDWKTVYLELLDDLSVSNLRLNSYWSDIEAVKGVYDFAELDFMMQQAQSRSRKVILVLGLRQPRWPECHQPAWASDLSDPARQEKIYRLIKAVVERYKSYTAVTGWQVENEFFVKWFGNCPIGDVQNLKKEIELVRSLDNRPIITTDSGELSLWFRAASYADIFGTTMYRKVYGPFGKTVWPYPPVYYSRLGKVVQFLTGFKRLINVELQAEPWGKNGLVNDSTEVNYETLSPAQFADNLRFARNSGIDETYLWGAEWWYYMKAVRGVDDYWNEAKKLWH